MEDISKDLNFKLERKGNGRHTWNKNKIVSIKN